MTDSILTSTKLTLGLDEAYEAFDQVILMHINSVFTTLAELGIGPTEGFAIENKDAEWSDFLGPSLRLNAVKSYMYLRVRVLFDPPTQGFVLTSMENQIQQMEWRLNVVREEQVYPLLENPDVVIFGGTP